MAAQRRLARERKGRGAKPKPNPRAETAKARVASVAKLTVMLAAGLNQVAAGYTTTALEMANIITNTHMLSIQTNIILIVINTRNNITLKIQTNIIITPTSMIKDTRIQTNVQGDGTPSSTIMLPTNRINTTLINSKLKYSNTKDLPNSILNNNIRIPINIIVTSRFGTPERGAFVVIAVTALFKRFAENWKKT